MNEEDSALNRVARLKDILRGLSSVNQLVARERDPDTLLDKAAHVLVEARGFEAVTIVRTEAPAETRAFVAGKPERVAAMRRVLDVGAWPECLLRATRDGEQVVRGRRGEVCDACPAKPCFERPGDAIAVPIEHERRRYGAILAALPEGGASRGDELGLLTELASDLALGLRNLELDAALRESERRYRMLAESISDVIWVADIDTMRFTYVSPSVERLRGLTVEEVMAEPMAAAITPGSAAYLASVMPGRRASFERGEVQRFVDQIEQPRRDGGTVWTETTTRYARDEVTGHVIVFGTSRDITDRRRAELALRESEDRFRRALENIPDVIVIYDRELRIRYINAATRAVTGRSASEYLGRRDEELWPAEVCGTWLPTLTRALRTGEQQRVEVELELAGNKRFLEITCVPLLDESGEVREIVGVTHDATSHRERLALQERFASVAASVPGMVHTFRIDADGRESMPFCTTDALDLLGFTPEELARDISPWMSRVDPEDLAPMVPRLAECARSLSRWHAQHRYHHPTKGLRWLEIWSSPSRKPDGAIEWYGVMMDVTERRLAEEAARAGNERYRSLFESMSSACVHARIIFEDGEPVDWVYVAANRAFERLTRSSDVAGKRISELAPTLHQTNPDLRQRYGRVVRTGEPARFESFLPQLGRWLSVSAHRTGPGEFVAILDDVTERRTAEQLLRESEARFRAVFEEAGVGVAQVETRTGRYVLANEKCCEIMGRSREELLGSSWQAVTHPDDLEEDHAMMERFMAGAWSSYSREKRYLRRDGAVVWVHLTLSRMWAEGEEPTFHVTVIEDVTARKRAEAALLKAQAELRALTTDLERRVAERTAELDRAARAKDEFLASMSHELRTPLNGILGLAEALSEGVYGPVGARQVGALARVEESGRHLLALINDILDVAKVEAGKVELTLAPVSVEDVCRASLRLVQEPAMRKRIATRMNVPPGLPPLPADERRLKQVLVNLLTNAVKFTPEGGAVGLDVTADEASDRLRIVVSDTGVGIAKEDLARLFQPFVQLDSRLSREHTGTGLGLALVRRLVALHGGEVRVESEVGRGSRFIITLPFQAPAAPLRAAQAHNRAATPPLGIVTASTVLVVDDDETNRTLLRDYLEHHGYVVHEACDGREGVDAARSLRPDVILMDVQMPGLDGLGATRAIRASAEAPRTPIIALTALAMPGDEARCREAGMSEYLAKPIALPRLLVMIERLTTGRG